MPEAILLQDVEDARRAGRGGRRLQGLPAQLPDSAQARPAGDEGRDRGDSPAPGRPPSAPRATRSRARRRTSACSTAPCSRSPSRQAPTGACSARYRAGHRQRDPRSARPEARQTQRAPARADQERRHLHGRGRGRRGRAPPRSRRWSSPRSSAAVHRAPGSPRVASRSTCRFAGSDGSRRRATSLCRRLRRREHELRRLSAALRTAFVEIRISAICGNGRPGRAGRDLDSREPMSAVSTANGAGARRRGRDRAAAQPRGRAVGARRDPALRSLAVRAGDRGGPARRRTSTASATARSTRRCSRSTTKASRSTC